MNRFIARLLDRLDRDVLEATTFCDECGEICTRACRQDAVIDHYRQAVYRDSIVRFH